jgi:hypothetical protein
MRSGNLLTAHVPTSATEVNSEPTSLGSQVAPHLRSLPTSEPPIPKMIFVPMTQDETAAFRSGAEMNHYQGCAATASLVASMETDTVMEEAEYAAISNAGVLAMVLKPNASRLVVAAEVRVEQVIDRGAPQGQVEVNGLTWAQVRALFADEPAARKAVRLARKTVAGRSLAAALVAPKVAAVLDKYPLMWYAPEELDQLWGRSDSPGDLRPL